MTAAHPTPSTERRPSAVFSACTGSHSCPIDDCPWRLYRYLLRWPTAVDNDRVCLFILANPSTATAEQTDPTVARVIDYAGRWGFGWAWVANVRGWRATDPKKVPPDPKAIGTMNDSYIAQAAQQAELVVCGWGVLGADRGPAVLEIVKRAGKVPHALRLTKDGHPRHPLYLPKTLKPFAIGADQ